MTVEQRSALVESPLFAQRRASTHASPLRYPGGKAKLAPYFKAIVRENNLLDGIYVEPFAGGCGVGLSLLFHGYVDQIIINDLSAPIYAFWRAVTDQPDLFRQRILNVELSREEWLRQKAVFQDQLNPSSFDLGFATFYLNRTNRSGVLNGGMIGGHAQNAEHNIDARFNRQELAARVTRIERNRSKIRILNMDAKSLIKNVQDVSSSKCPLMYIDPPYYRKGRDLYYDFYQKDDHRLLRDVVQGVDAKIPWIVSYDNEPEIIQLYSNYRKAEYNLSYSVRNGRVGKEVMFYSSSLAVVDLNRGGLKQIEPTEQLALPLAV